MSVQESPGSGPTAMSRYHVTFKTLLSFSQWDAFSFPELCNFLRMLQREEEVHIRQIVKRYALAREEIKQAMSAVSILC